MHAQRKKYTCLLGPTLSNSKTLKETTENSQNVLRFGIRDIYNKTEYVKEERKTLTLTHIQSTIECKGNTRQDKEGKKDKKHTK